ncbi:BglG family transcription antiterminator [Paucisalibacillus sp. EB02]|uniref:BglG family transcription antiterminator n=1 Tax=Paucisalibacillus sp. EB02 TaxID=1347087 RepID=UPI0004AE592C|nr:BglG family transcription antiterminator [Paucisalibacillus sp. EB02]
MNKKENLLIRFLFKMNDWVKADILATQFAVTTRTIRNYVNSINEKMAPDELIISSQHGYKINESVFHKYNEDFVKTEPKKGTPQERLAYLMKQIILNADGIDIFDVSEKLFASIPTIEGDLKKAKMLLEKFNLSFTRTGYSIQLNGLEQDKRKLMSYIFYNESNNQLLSLNNIQEAFGYDLEKFKEQLITILARYNLDVNEYTVGNIVLHIVIATDRIKNNRMIHEEGIVSLHQKEEYKAALDIAKLIEAQFNVKFDKSELYYLTILLISKTTLLDIDSLTADNLNQYIEEEYIDLVHDIIHKISEYYLVDIYDDDFFIKFTLHVRNLINRARHNYLSRNPLTNQIKSAYPSIYDLAVFISNEIQKKEQVTINEDEIAYIAFHIGAFLERKKGLENKMTCTIVCPKYYNMHLDMAKKIKRTLGKYIEVNRVITRIDTDLQKIDSDLIITAVEVQGNHHASEVIHVNPILTEDDLENIHQTVVQLKRAKYRNNLKEQLFNLFDPHLFQRNIYFDNEFKMIRYIGERMNQLGFIQEEYIDEVIEREKMSSTAFNNNVAVPHSMQMNAIRSSISIVLNEKPLKWGSHTVQIIALIAINKSERKVFRDIYDNFIRIISEPENVHLLLQSKNYDSFIDSLLSLMEK